MTNSHSNSLSNSYRRSNIHVRDAPRPASPPPTRRRGESGPPPPPPGPAGRRREPRPRHATGTVTPGPPALRGHVRPPRRRAVHSSCYFKKSVSAVTMRSDTATPLCQCVVLLLAAAIGHVRGTLTLRSFDNSAMVGAGTNATVAGLEFSAPQIHSDPPSPPPLQCAHPAAPPVTHRDTARNGDWAPHIHTSQRCTHAGASLFPLGSCSGSDPRGDTCHSHTLARRCAHGRLRRFRRSHRHGKTRVRRSTSCTHCLSVCGGTCWCCAPPRPPAHASGRLGGRCAADVRH